MQKTQLEDSEPKRGWPSKKVMAGRSGKVFSLDFLFIEQRHESECDKLISNVTRTVMPGIIRFGPQSQFLKCFSSISI